MHRVDVDFQPLQPVCNHPGPAPAVIKLCRQRSPEPRVINIKIQRHDMNGLGAPEAGQLNAIDQFKTNLTGGLARLLKAGNGVMVGECQMGHPLVPGPCNEVRGRQGAV